MSSAAKAVHLLAELYHLDQGRTRDTLTLLERQRRSAICRELSAWALELLERDRPPGAVQREHPRAPVRAKVQLLGGPHRMDLVSESLAVGGLSVRLTSFTPRVGDLWALRLWVAGDAPPALDQPAAEQELETALDLMAQVAWVDPVRGRAGARFVDVPEEARAVLERVVFRELVQAARSPRAR